MCSLLGSLGITLLIILQVDYFCEYNKTECGTVRYVCNTDFIPNPTFNYTRDQFDEECFDNLLNSLQMALNLLHHQYFSAVSGQSICARPGATCFRASHDQTASLESFRAILRERQQSLPSSLVSIEQVIIGDHLHSTLNSHGAQLMVYSFFRLLTMMWNADLLLYLNRLCSTCTHPWLRRVESCPLYQTRVTLFSN